MRSIRGIILEQARLSRERARFYRELAHTLSGNRSVPELEKCARDLDARAQGMEDFAKRGESSKGDGRLADPPLDDEYWEMNEGNPVNELQHAVAIAFEAGIKARPG
jgi:hypothetical protein